MSEGVVTIAPHYAAQGLLDALPEMRSVGANVSPDLEREYVYAAVKALKALTGDLPPGASFGFVIAAYRNSNGLGTKA